MAGSQIRPVQMVVQCCPTEILQQILSLLYHMQSGIVIENYAIAKETGTLCVPTRTCITPQTSKLDQFVKWVTMLNCHSSCPSVHMLRIRWLWTVEPSVIYVNRIWNFNKFGILNNRACKLFFDSPLQLYDILKGVCVLSSGLSWPRKMSFFCLQ